MNWSKKIVLGIVFLLATGVLVYELILPSFEDVVEGSHNGPYLSGAEWVQPEEPHPYLDCWVLQHKEAPSQHPYLIWCDDDQDDD